VAVVSQLSDHLTLAGNMPLGFDDVPSSLRQMVRYRGSVHVLLYEATCDCVPPFRRVGMSLAAPGCGQSAPAYGRTGIEARGRDCAVAWLGILVAYHRQLPTGVGS
jgi:hypothetical protein